MKIIYVQSCDGDMSFEVLVKNLNLFMRLRFAMEFILAEIQLWIESQMLMKPQIKRRKI